MPSLYPPLRADSIGELASVLTLDPAALEQTVRAFDAAVQPGSTILPASMTAGRKAGASKTHWARRIEQAPYYAYPVRPGITFTYLGTRVNRQAQIIMADRGLGQHVCLSTSWQAMCWARAMRPALV